MAITPRAKSTVSGRSVFLSLSCHCFMSPPFQTFLAPKSGPFFGLETRTSEAKALSCGAVFRLRNRPKLWLSNLARFYS